MTTLEKRKHQPSDKPGNKPLNWLLQGFLWGGLMFVMMGVFYPWASGEAMTVKRISFGFLWWMTIGLIYRYIMKHFLQSTRKKKDRELQSRP